MSGGSVDGALWIETAQEEDVLHPRSLGSLEPSEELDQARIGGLQAEGGCFVERVGETAKLFAKLETEIVDWAGPQKPVKISSLSIRAAANGFVVGQAHPLMEQTLAKNAAPDEGAISELTIEASLLGSIGLLDLFEHLYQRLLSWAQGLSTGTREVGQEVD